MKITWVIVANQAEARIYESRGLPWNINLLKTLVHEEGAAYARDLVSDAPGRSHDRKGSGRHAMEPSTGVKEASLRKFVKEVTGLIDTAHFKHKFDQLVILAAPAVLGFIRKSLGSGVTGTVVKEIPKDVVGPDTDHLVTHLKRAFELK